MKIALKLPLAFAAGLLLVAAAALFGISRLHQAIHTFETEVHESHARAAQASHLLSQFKTQVQEWKNTLLRGKDPAQLDKYWTAFNKIEKEMAEQSRTLAAALPAGKSRELVEQFSAAHATMGQNYRTAFETFKSSGFDHAVGDKAVSGMDRAPAKLLDEAVQQIAADSTALAARANADATTATTISLSLMGLVCLVGMAGGAVFSRTITTPIQRAVDTAELVASGDLTTRVSASGRDEIAQLLNALQVMQEKLATVVREVRANSESVAAASAQIAQGNQDLSQRTEQQASALQETARASHPEVPPSRQRRRSGRDRGSLPPPPAPARWQTPPGSRWSRSCDARYGGSASSAGGSWTCLTLLSVLSFHQAAGPCPSLPHQCLVHIKRFFEIFVILQSPAFQHEPCIAIFAQLPQIVADENRARLFHAFAEHRAAFHPETGIAHGGHLVHQIGVEADPHRGAKGQTRPHPRGIAAHRQMEMLAQFGEILDEGAQAFGIHPIDAGDEADVLRARQILVQRSAQTDRPADRPV